MSSVGIVVNSLSGGGAEKAARTLFQEFLRRGMSVHYIGVNAENPLAISTDANVHCLDRDKNTPIRGTAIALLRFLLLLRKLNISKVIVYCELPELLVALVPTPLRIVVIEQANPSWFERDVLGKAVRKILLFRNSKFVTSGSHIRPRFTPIINPHNIPNPLDNASLLKFVNTGRDIERLLYIGRLSNSFKNPQLLIELGKTLELPILYVGDGEMRQFLSDYAKSNNVTVNFSGFIGSPWREYRKGDLLIIPSTAEGDGLVLMEAIQRGVPFLARDIPDLNRYNIGDIHYCKQIEDFESRIELFRYQISNLVVPRKLAASILSKRNVSLIVDEWQNLLF